MAGITGQAGPVGRMAPAGQAGPAGPGGDEGGGAYAGGGRRLVDMVDMADMADMAGGVPAPRTGGLRHSGGPWTRAAGAAEALRTHIGLVRGELADAHEGLAAGTAGLGAAAVLRTVRMSWERRIEIAMGECEGLAVHLRGVARDQGENEAAISSSLVSFASSGASSGARAGGGAR